MPVSTKKNAEFVQSTDFTAQDDPDDFIQDPDLHRDELPQPFRMIDKLISRLLDDVWEVVSSRESDRLVQASKFRPPQYCCSIGIQEHGAATCLSATPDGQYIVIGQDDGLAILKAETQQTLDVWTDSKMHITSLNITGMSQDIYLINTIDDMGACRIFSFAGLHLYLMHSMSEQDGGGKALVNRCEASVDSDYLGVHMEKPSSQEVWLDIHRLPTEAWQKDLEGLVAKSQPKEPTQDKPSTPAGDQGGSDTLAPPGARDDASGTDDARSLSPASQRSDRSTHKFASPTHVLRVRPPGPLTGVNHSSPVAAMKSVDVTGDVIGSGQSHMISVQHLEQRVAMFNQLHSDHMQYMPEDEKPTASQPTFHFLKPGRILTQGLDQPGTADQTSGVCVWWTDQTQLTMYSLLKQHKDLEHKPEVVWPLSSGVTASAISPDASLLAVGLTNGSLIVWDMYFGVPRGVMRVCDTERITTVMFVDPSTCPQDVAPYPPYPMATACYVMVVLDDGQTFLVNTRDMVQQAMDTIDLTIENGDWVPTYIHPVDGIPDLLLTCRRNGSMFLHDLRRGQQLCEVVLPPEYDITSPWEPLIAIGNGGGMLYLKGSLKDAQPGTKDLDLGEENPEESAEDTPAKEKLFVFTLRSFPTLDKYRTKQRPHIPYMVHSTAQTRTDALMKERIAQQALRKPRMQQRWGQLQRELDLIKQMRDSRQKSAA